MVEQYVRISLHGGIHSEISTLKKKNIVCPKGTQKLPSNPAKFSNLKTICFKSKKTTNRYPVYRFCLNCTLKTS